MEEKLEQSFKAIRQQSQDRKMITYLYIYKKKLNKLCFQINIFIELLRSIDIYL